MEHRSSFHERHGYQSISEFIKIRYEASDFFRRGIVSVAFKSDFNSKELKNELVSILPNILYFKYLQLN